MLIEAAQRAEAAMSEMLAAVKAGAASRHEMREALKISRAFMAAGNAFQLEAAACIAARERHGDGGAGVLAEGTGVTQREARGQVKTAQTLSKAPTLQAAVESGKVSATNARKLADAVERVGAAVVERDKSLLDKAATMRPEDFGPAAKRWTVEREGDHGASEHARQRSRRSLRIRDGEGGMIHLHAEFDRVTGERIVNRLRDAAGRMHRADQEQANRTGAPRRSFDQCMADALDEITAPGSGHKSGQNGVGQSFADICVVAHVDDDTAKLIGELADGTRLPSSVLDELTANAKITGLVYDRRGKPLWKTESCRTATEAQRQALNARWGGCFHCRTNIGITQPHHIKPVSQGGATNLDNLVPACWDCHNLIHKHRWRVRICPDGNHTLHPPDPTHYGSLIVDDDGDQVRPTRPPPGRRSTGRSRLYPHEGRSAAANRAT